MPPDSYKLYNPNGNCCEIVIATAYNTLTGETVRVEDLVRMGFPSNRFGGMQMVQQLNRPERGQQRFYMEPFEVNAFSTKKIERIFRRHLSQGELIYLVVYVGMWWKHIFEGHGDIGNSRHAVLIHNFDEENKKISFHIFDPLQWKDGGRVRAGIDQFWPTLFLMQGFEGKMARLMDVERVEFAVFTY